MPEQPLTLQQATISLYLLDEDGNPTGDPILLDACAEDLKLNYRFDVVTTKPTGRKYPRRRIINEEHEITIGKVWVYDSEAGDLLMSRTGRFIMVIQWEGMNSVTYTRTYHGVTDGANDLTSRQIEFVQNLTFNAEFFI